MISAACLPVRAGDAPVREISDAAALREVLTATSPNASGEGSVATYDGYTLKITPAELLVPVTPGVVSDSNPNGIIVPVATDILLTGSGSAATVLRSDGAGDLFGIGNLSYAFSNLRIDGSGTDVNNADGRFAILSAAAVTVRGDTVFADRFFSANEKTSNAASGGIFYSSNTFDSIVLDASAGSIDFSRITTYGDTLSVAGETSKNAAAGGVIFLTGALKIQGGNAVNFTGNVAESESADAFGGVLYVTSSAEKPEDYGMFLSAGTRVNFSGNHAIGENAQGGAAIWVASALDMKGATMNFSGNAVEARSGVAAGGALVLAGGAVGKADATSGLTFSGNTAEALGTCTTAVGGAVYIEDSVLKSPGALSFSGNKALSSADGTSAWGGALAVAGEKALVELTGTATTLDFSENSVVVGGKSMEKTVTENGVSSVKTFLPEALGGALAVVGGKVSLTDGGLARFYRNSATVSRAGTEARGGAIYVGGATTSVSFSASKAWSFVENSATANGAGSAFGGAIAQDAGELKFAFSEDSIFSGNKVSGTVSGAESLVVWGGAIAQRGGTQSYALASGATLLFSENAANVSTETSGSSARGGAIALCGKSSVFTINGASRFSGNSASANVTGSAAADGAVSAAQGGAVFSAGVLSLGDAVFESNFASAKGESASAFGGAVYLSGGTLNAANLTFENNEVLAMNAAGSDWLGSARGGAIYQSSGTATLQSARFANNRANGEIARGGAAYLGGVLSANARTTFSENCVSALREASGGAVYLAGNLALGEAVFSGNEATASGDAGLALGGAIYAAGDLKITGTATSFSGNKVTATGSDAAAFGGALYLKGGNHYLANTTISGNAATGANAAGGAVYIDASGNAATTLILAGNTTISGNTTNGAADGIFVGTGNAASTSSAKNVNLKIAPGATFSSSTDADGNEVVTRDTFETVTLADPLRVALKGADFTFEKTADDGDFVWSGSNEINVESLGSGNSASGGRLEFVFRSGKTTLANGFSLTGTKAAAVGIATGAELSVASEAELWDFAEMNLNGTLSVAGAMNFSDSKITVGKTGNLLFEDGASADVIGKNTINGTLTTRGNVVFKAEFPNGATEASLAVTQLNLEKSGNVEFSGGSADAGFTVTAGNICFAESGTLTLGTGTKLLLNSVDATHPETALNIAVAGAGTLVLLDKTEENNTIAFNSYYDAENKKLVASHFSVASGVTIENGIFVSSGTTLDLGGLNYKNVVVDAGTLVASGSGSANPMELETLSIKSSATLGDGKSAQVIRLRENVDANGVSTPQKVALSGDLKLAKNTTFVADISLQNYASAGVSGEGTLQGNVDGAGNISVAAVNGNVSVNSTDRTTFAKTVFVSGNISNSGRLTLAQDAFLSVGGIFKNEVAGQADFQDGTRFSGKIENAGKLTLNGNSVMEAGSSLTQTNSGTLMLEPGAGLDVSAIAGSAGAVSLAGTLVITPADYAAGEEFTGLLGLKDGQLDDVKITDSASNLLTDRIVWNDALGSYVFLGLNGRRVETTLYGDLMRENIFRLYDFMRAGLVHGKVASIRPSVFGENKVTSRYMRKYLERKNRFDSSDNKPNVPAPTGEFSPGEFGRAADALMDNVWVQTQYAHTNASKSDVHPDYDINAWGTLIGSSVATSREDEIGAVFGYNHSRMKHSGENSHKIDIEAYELMGFYRHTGETYDGTLALSGAYATNDSERGKAEADFNSWQIGALAEGGVTFRPEPWCEIRPFTAFQFAYSRTDSFREKASEDAFKLDSASTFAARGTFGLGLAFLPFDSTQVSFRAAWNLDLGDSVVDADAYQQSTRSDLRLTSREAERSSFELGAYLNYRVNANVSLYTGYTGLLRSGHEEHRADLGVNFAF